MKLAHSMTCDYRTGVVEIDGVPLPFYISEDGPSVETEPQGFVSTVWLPVMVSGVVTIRTDKGPQSYDPSVGEVGEYARRLVREGLLERLPWLRGVET